MHVILSMDSRRPLSVTSEDRRSSRKANLLKTQELGDDLLERSPVLWDDEGSPQFTGNIRWLAFQSNCRDSSAPQRTEASE